MSESVWFEQVDTALINFIQKNIIIDGKPVKAKVRKPDEDFDIEDYPLVSVYNLYDRFSTYRYNPEGSVTQRDVENNALVFEDPALPYDLYYQIDFWSILQSDMNEMTKQWKAKTKFWFNLDVQDESGNPRSCFVLMRNDVAKSDLLQKGRRVFHSFGTYKIQVEIDEKTQSTQPMVTKTVEVHVNGHKLNEEEQKPFNPIESLIINNGESSLVTSVSGDYIRIDLDKGEESLSIHKNTTDGSKYFLTDIDGNISEDSSHFVLSLSDNLLNVAGNISFVLSNGETKDYKIFFHLRDNPSNYDLIEDIKLIRTLASLEYDEFGRESLRAWWSGNSTDLIGFYISTSKGNTISCTSNSGIVFMDRADAYVAYASSNVKYLYEEILTVTLSNGEEYHCKVIFDFAKS